tara:strand:+ start:33 stop:689 length:657 start_codon:yes stop_codon:yes gene_type:complete
MQFNNLPPGVAATESPPVYLTKVASGSSNSNSSLYNFSVTVPGATRAYRTFWVESWVVGGPIQSASLAGLSITAANNLANAQWDYFNGHRLNTGASGTKTLAISTLSSERCAYVLWAAESDLPITFENETVYRTDDYVAYSLSKAYARGDAVTATAATASGTWNYSEGGGLTNAFHFPFEGTNNMGGASLSEAGSPGTATWGTTGTSYSYASVTKFTN